MFSDLLLRVCCFCLFGSLWDMVVAYPDRVACSTALTVGGTSMMGVSPTSSTARTIYFTRVSDSSTLNDGDFYVAGESLTAHISSTGSYYVLEINTDGFSSYTCSESTNGYTRVNSYTEGANGANGLTVTAPTSGDLTLKAVWATSYGGAVRLNTITLYEPTPSPTNSPSKSLSPTMVPSNSNPPSMIPTLSPSSVPSISSSPSMIPTSSPTSSTPEPTKQPTSLPTSLPTLKPTSIPTLSPSAPPSISPTSSPIVSSNEDDGDFSNNTEAPVSVGTATCMGFGLFFLFGAPFLAFFKYNAAIQAIGYTFASDDNHGLPTSVVNAGDDGNNQTFKRSLNL
mmetsp:Transcript_19712/g.23455  ORF Transcript_19712/g.23455 Transcript_19712/m.23455 type:complete len:340 (-) Transcript_19712:118-1137(-)